MKQGDDAALELFVHRYYDDILKYCRYHCADNAFAEDLAQETFVHFFEKLSVYHYRGRTKNYLYTIAGNLCRDFYKKVKEVPIDKMPETEENQTNQILNKIIVENALKELPDELREVIILYYFQELKISEIANILNIGLPLTKYRLKRGRTLLEHLMRKEDLYEDRRTVNDL